MSSYHKEFLIFYISVLLISISFSILFVTDYYINTDGILQNLTLIWLFIGTILSIFMSVANRDFDVRVISIIILFGAISPIMMLLWKLRDVIDN